MRRPLPLGVIGPTAAVLIFMHWQICILIETGVNTQPSSHESFCCHSTARCTEETKMTSFRGLWRREFWDQERERAGRVGPDMCSIIIREPPLFIQRTGCRVGPPAGRGHMGLSSWRWRSFSVAYWHLIWWKEKKAWWHTSPRSPDTLLAAPAFSNSVRQDWPKRQRLFARDGTLSGRFQAFNIHEKDDTAALRRWTVSMNNRFPCSVPKLPLAAPGDII